MVGGGEALQEKSLVRHRIHGFEMGFVSSSPTAEECWFCLSNPNLAYAALLSTWRSLTASSISKHLIVSIGTECYVTLPKGQIVPTHTAGDHPNAPKIPGGGHVLIVPITHYPTFSSIPPDLAPPILRETERCVCTTSV